MMPLVAAFSLLVVCGGGLSGEFTELENSLSARQYSIIALNAAPKVPLFPLQ